MTSTSPRGPDDSVPSLGDELDSRVYSELRALAGDFLRRERSDHSLQPTALVHEAWIRLSSQDATRWNGRAQFFCIAAQAMRRILVDHARRRISDKRGGGMRRVTMPTNLTPADDAAELDVLAVNDALGRLAELNARQARVVELRFFAGLSVDEIADALQVSARTVASEWRMARAWLSVALSGAKGDE